MSAYNLKAGDAVALRGKYSLSALYQLRDIETGSTGIVTEAHTNKAEFRIRFFLNPDKPRWVHGYDLEKLK